MAFYETPRFPEKISYGSSAGPEFNTSVIILGSGHEQRNVNWQEARHRYDVSYGVKDWTDLETLKEYFISMQGRAHGFRFKDPIDFSTAGVNGTVTNADVQIGTGDGNEVDFQILKQYNQGAVRTRDITKPVSGTLLVAVNGVAQVEGVDYTVDYTTGVITFAVAPAATLAVTCGCEFDVPVRFDTDRLSTNFEDYQLGSATVPVVEIKV